MWWKLRQEDITIERNSNQVYFEIMRYKRTTPLVPFPKNQLPGRAAPLLVWTLEERFIFQLLLTPAIELLQLPCYQWCYVQRFIHRPVFHNIIVWYSMKGSFKTNGCQTHVPEGVVDRPPGAMLPMPSFAGEGHQLVRRICCEEKIKIKAGKEKRAHR